VKRNALLIGNTGGLQGVAVDVRRTHDFLTSPTGGRWLGNEITVLMNPRKDDVQSHINRMRREQADYCFFLFSGHGCHYGQTHLVLNEQGERLDESSLNGLADRQLSIFDCCRVEEERRQITKALESAAMTFDESDSAIRKRYEKRILAALPQHAKLYACSVGEFSYDYPEGALYLSSLLSSARSVGNRDEWKTVEKAHDEARANTIIQAMKEKHRQTPNAKLPKVPAEWQLILSIK
jgi:hypothetical protein